MSYDSLLDSALRVSRIALYTVAAIVLLMALSGCATPPPPCPPGDLECRMTRLEQAQRRAEFQQLHQQNVRQGCQMVHGAGSIHCN